MMRKAGIWAAVLIAVAGPILFAAMSPLLAWRQPVYVIGGFAGIIGLVLLLLQPLLVAGVLPGLDGLRGRRAHRVIGAVFVLAVILHVAGLWVTSPPDVVDALLFVSPTPFALWGVLAMWAAFAAAGLTLLRRRFGWRLWRVVHSLLAVVIIAGTCAHALLIEGAMEAISKALLCACVGLAALRVIADPAALKRLTRRV